MSGTALLYAACKPSEPKKSESTVPAVVETSHRALTNDEYDAVPEYIDRALVTPTLSHVRDEFVRGTDVLMRRAQARHQKPFAALAPALQDALLTEFKDSPQG